MTAYIPPSPRRAWLNLIQSREIARIMMTPEQKRRIWRRIKEQKR